MKLVHWLLMGGLLHLVQLWWTGRGRSLPRPLLAVPNVTDHPSAASVYVTVLLYNGPLLCGFNVPTKGLKWLSGKVCPDKWILDRYIFYISHSPFVLCKYGAVGSPSNVVNWTAVTPEFSIWGQIHRHVLRFVVGFVLRHVVRSSVNLGPGFFWATL